MSNPLPAAVRDPARLAALRRRALLDTPAEASFDRLTRLAARLLRAPVALLSLVDEGRQFFKSAVGLPEPWAARRETPLTHSFCQHLLALDEPLVIPDAARHPLVCDNLAIRDLAVRAYLGIPLKTTDGAILGAFCVIDGVPRAWSADDVDLLRELTASVMAEIELRAEVAERRRAEAELRQSEARKAAILDAALDAIITIDAAGLVLEFNPAAERTFGYPRAEVVGRDMSRLIVPAAFRAAHHTGMQRYLATGESRVLDRRIEVSAVRADGAEFPVELTVTRIAAADPPVFTAHVRDITDRRRAEAELRRLNEGLEARVRERTAELLAANEGLRRATDFSASMIASLPGVFYLFDEGGAMLRWNRNLEQVTGYPADEIARLHPLDLVAAEDRATVRQKIEQVFADGQASVEAHLAGRDGRRTPFFFASLRTVLDGRTCLMGTGIDISEKKRLEAQSLRAQRMEGLGTLAGGIAHDLNNVLTPILMGVDLLGMKLQDPTSRALVQSLHTSVTRGADMVRQILLFARGTEGQRQPVLLGAVVRDLEKMLGHTLPKSIAVRAELPPDLWPVLGDTTQLHQVLLNLCVNARDAMPHGGAVAVRAENAVIDAQYAQMHLDARPGRYVRVTVADTGTGIPAAVRERIFDPFFTTKEAGKGTGLGLSTVLGIVKSHDGFLHLTSEAGRGTTFAVYLPADPGGAGAAAAAPARPAVPAGRGELILVVDDEAGVREITRATLEAHGYRVVTAGDGAEALMLAAQHLAELGAVLTDMMMPVMDGPSMIRALRRLDPTARVVAASGLADRPRADDLRVEAFLAKPYTAETLLRTLQAVLAVA